MKTVLKAVLIIFVFALLIPLCSTDVHALSLAEYSTHQLIAESEYIVLGHVFESINLEDDVDYPSAEHKVRVVHSYRGDLEKGEIITVRESLGGTSNMRSDYPAVLFLMTSFVRPGQYATVNNFQGLVELDSKGNFRGYGLFDAYTLSELEEIFRNHEYSFSLDRDHYPGERVADFSPLLRRRIKLGGIFEGLKIIIEWDAAEQRLLITH